MNFVNLNTTPLTNNISLRMKLTEKIFVNLNTTHLTNNISLRMKLTEKISQLDFLSNLILKLNCVKIVST